MYGWETHRRALKAAGEVDKAWRAVLMRDPCVYCGNPPDGLDHITPESKGGTNGWENRAPACRSCDGTKQSAGLLYFMTTRSLVAAVIAHRSGRYRTEQAKFAAGKTLLSAACRSQAGTLNKPKMLPPWLTDPARAQAILRRARERTSLGLTRGSCLPSDALPFDTREGLI